MSEQRDIPNLAHPDCLRTYLQGWPERMVYWGKTHDERVVFVVINLPRGHQWVFQNVDDHIAASIWRASTQTETVPLVDVAATERALWEEIRSGRSLVAHRERIKKPTTR